MAWIIVLIVWLIGIPVTYSLVTKNWDDKGKAEMKAKADAAWKEISGGKSIEDVAKEQEYTETDESDDKRKKKTQHEKKESKNLTGLLESSFDDAQKPTKSASVLSEKQTTNLIEGWKSGVEGMKIGGVREITIPSELGYGDTEMGDIPKNSVLKFVIVALDPIGDDWSDRMSELSSKMQSYLLQQQLQQQTEKSDDTSAKQDESKSNSK